MKKLIKLLNNINNSLGNASKNNKIVLGYVCMLAILYMIISIVWFVFYKIPPVQIYKYLYVK